MQARQVQAVLPGMSSDVNYTSHEDLESRKPTVVEETKASEVHLDTLEA